MPRVSVSGRVDATGRLPINTLAYDSCTGPAGQIIEHHRGEKNIVWFQHPISITTAVISNANRFRKAANTALYYLDVNPTSANYSIEADITVVDTTIQATGISVRMDRTVNTHYTLRLSGAAPGNWELGYFNAGSFTTLQSVAATTIVGGTYRMRLEANGTSIRGYVNDVLTVQATDSTITAAGVGGIRFQGTGGSNTVGRHLDNIRLIDPGVNRIAVSGRVDPRNPMTMLPWVHAFWASDPLWSNPGNGNAVSSWRNGGSNGTAATQATVALRPIYQSSVAIMNNKPAILFDGSDDVLSATGLSLARPYTIVAVGRFNRLGNPERMMTVTTQNNSGMGHAGGNQYTLTIGNTGIAAGTANNTAPVLMVGYVMPDNTARLSVNGVVIATGAVANTAFDRILLGNGNTSDRGLLGELVWGSAISGDALQYTQWANFKQFFGSEYNFTVV